MFPQQSAQDTAAYRFIRLLLATIHFTLEQNQNTGRPMFETDAHASELETASLHLRSRSADGCVNLC